MISSDDGEATISTDTKPVSWKCFRGTFNFFTGNDRNIRARIVPLVAGSSNISKASELGTVPSLGS